MKKLLQINPVIRINTSTGRIMQEIGELAEPMVGKRTLPIARGVMA